MDIVLSSQMLAEPGEVVVLLPAATRYEIPGGVTETSTERRIMFSPEIEGPRIGEARPEWEVFSSSPAGSAPSSPSARLRRHPGAARGDRPRRPRLRRHRRPRRGGRFVPVRRPRPLRRREFPTPDVRADFDDRLAGTEAGQTLTFTSTPSGTDDPADFTVAVKKVQTLIPPELTDEWVGDHLGEFETADEWRAAIRERMEAGRLNNARQLLLDNATSALAQLVEEEVLEPLVNSELRSRAENLVNGLQAQGVSMEQALTGEDPATLTEGLKGQRHHCGEGGPGPAVRGRRRGDRRLRR